MESKTKWLLIGFGLALFQEMLAEEPCTCYQTPEVCGCQCFVALSPEYFRSLADKFGPCDDFSLRLYSGEYDSFPPNFFSKVGHVKQFTLDVSSVTFENFLDPTPGTSPFRGVFFEKSATIQVYSSNVKKEWNWSAMSELTSEKGDATVRIRDTPMTHLPSEFSTILGGRAIEVHFTSLGLLSMDNDIFSKFKDLTELAIVENNLETVKRTQFPKPARLLKELYLAQNKLKELPKDLFTEMPALRNVYLGENPITTLDEETFQPILGKAKIWGVEDFPLYCDCKLAWMKDIENNQDFRKAKCSSPPHLKGKLLLEEVSADQLVC